MVAMVAVYAPTTLINMLLVLANFSLTIDDGTNEKTIRLWLIINILISTFFILILSASSYHNTHIIIP